MRIPKPKREAKVRKPLKRGGRPARKSKTLRAKLIEEADERARAIVMLRGACERCGKGTDLQWAHGYSRRYLKTRWLDWANFCLCRGCHYWGTKHWEEWLVWMETKLGAELLKKVQMTALDRTPVKTTDIRDVIEELKRQAA